MKTTRFSGLVWVSLAMFALPASAQPPDKMTPASDTQCDDLAAEYPGLTPGLQGLCVALCEAAPGCEGAPDPVTGDMEFNDSCNTSAGQVYANYVRKTGPNDPPPPCIKEACPCWTEPGIENIGGNSDQCYRYPGMAQLFGNSPETGQFEMASVNKNGCFSSESSRSPADLSVAPISDPQFKACRQSVSDECVSRGELPPE